MLNLEHITEENLTAYQNRRLARSETLGVLRHAGACEVCRNKLSLTAAHEKAFAAVRSNFAFDDLTDEPEHLPYETLAFFVDEKLDDVEREIAESHLAICAECAEDLSDLRRFQQVAAAPVIAAETKTAVIEKKSFWQRWFALDAIGSFAPVAAMVLMAVLIGAFFLLRSNQTTRIEVVQNNLNQNAPVPSPSAAIVNPANNSSNFNAVPEVTPQTIVSPSPQIETLPDNNALLALSDAGGGVTVDERGNVSGLENLSPATRNAVQKSLQTGKISVSSASDSLGGNNGVLMSGGADSGVPFALRSPVGKIIRDAQPVLSWKPLDGANGYSVTIVDDKFRVVAESGKLTATNWKPAKPLPRGANYSWQVTAVKSDGEEIVSPASPAPQAKFRVLEQAPADEINRLEKAGKRSHLALGVLYAGSGLRAEARREFQLLVKENPKSPLARKLLASVR